MLKAIADLKGASETFSADHGELVSLREEVKTLKAENATRTASTAIDAAIRARKVLPAQREWAEAYAASDPKGFAVFVEKTPELVDTTERGSAGDAPEPQSEVAQFRAKVAEKVKGDGRADVDQGTKIADAQKAVAVEEPELFAAVYGRR